MTGSAGLLPEQVWDRKPIPEDHLEPGKPSGSAMPLVWAHAEFIKLCYSRALTYPVDRPIATWNRYKGKRPKISHTIWGPCYRPRRVRLSNRFTIALRSPANVHWGLNGWQDVRDMGTYDTELGVHIVDLPVAELNVGDTVQFTFYWLDKKTWERQEYEVNITE